MQRHHKERHDQYVEKFILQYIDSLREEGKQGTADAYMSGLRSLLRFCSPRKIKFKDVDYVFITDYMHYLRARGVAENTVHMYLSNFRAICNKARKQGGEGWQGQSVCRFGHSQAGDGETGFEQGGNSTYRFGQSQAASPVGAGAGFVHVQFLLPRHVVCGCHSS